MSLRAIVQTLGGELYDHGRRANIPAPGHSAADRSVSLLLEGDRVVVHTFGDGDWRAVLDQLRDLNLIDAANAPLDGPGPGVGRPAREPASDRERQEAALRLWDAGKPLGHTLAARYCRLRGLTQALPGPQALRHHGEVPISVYRPGRLCRQALLAGIQAPDGRYVAVEVTYLAASGRRAIDLRLPRKTIGATPPGCAVRLDSPAPAMLVGEGVFTTRSASERFGLPGWALQSTRNLRAWSPPDGVRSVLIAGDRGVDGQRSAEVLSRRLNDLGIAASIRFPPVPYGDWNELAAASAFRANAPDAQLEAAAEDHQG